MPIEASRVHGDLFQGSVPPRGPALARAGFDTLVLAAEEHQPPDYHFPGIVVIRLPMSDIPVRLDAREVRLVRLTARDVLYRLERGKKVLVTCAMGLNRSGLISATALVEGGLATPSEAIGLVRSARGPMALSNPAFVHAIATQLRRPR